MSDHRCKFRGCKKPFAVPKTAIRSEDIEMNNLQGRIALGDLICVRHYVPGSKQQINYFNTTGNLLLGARLDSSLTKSQRSSR